MLKSNQLGGSDASHKRGALIIGKAGSHCVILLYCEVCLQVLLVIYCKKFYWVPSFHYTTVVLRVEIGKAKRSSQNVLMKH